MNFEPATPLATFKNESFAKLGAVSLDNGSSLDTGGGGGETLIRAGSVTLDSNSAIRSVNTGSSSGGDISIVADTIVSLLDGAKFQCSTQGSGGGGDVSINVLDGSLDIDGSAAPKNATTGILEKSLIGASGACGDVTIGVSGEVDIGFRGQIASSTYSSQNAGSVTIHAQSMGINGSAEFTGGNSSMFKGKDVLTGIDATSASGSMGDAGDVNITVDGALNIENGGKIRSATNSTGDAGNVTVHAGAMAINGSEAVTGNNVFTGIDTESKAGATGNAMNVNVNVKGVLEILGGGQINASTYTTGHGGQVVVYAHDVEINGAAAPGSPTGIVDESLRGSLTDSGGNAGEVSVNVAGALDMRTGGQIISSTYSSGHAGDVTVHASSMDVDGSGDPTRLTGIDATSASMARGDAGNVGVYVMGALDLKDGGKIRSATNTPGNAGDVTVLAGSMDIDGSNGPGKPAAAGAFTGINTASNVGASGNAMNVDVTVLGPLSIHGGGEITASTASVGSAGVVTVHAGSVNIDGADALLGGPSGILDESEQGKGDDSGGAALALNVNVVGALNIENGGELIGSTDTIGNGAILKIAAGEIILNSGGEIGSNTVSMGNAGGVTIQAGAMSITGTPGDISGIDSFSEEGGPGAAGGTGGRAGSLTIGVTGALDIGRDGQIAASTSTSGVGGNVAIHARVLNVFNGAQIDADALSTGDGGQISINAQVLNIVNRGQIDAFTSSIGNGGTVDIAAGAITIESGGQIDSDTYSTGNGEMVTVLAHSLDIVGSGIPGVATGIETSSADGPASGPAGAAGALKVVVQGILDIRNGGEIAASTSTSGVGGTMNVYAGVLNINAGQIDAETSSTAVGGTINLGARAIVLKNGARIDADTFSTGHGGSVNIDAGSLDIVGPPVPGVVTGIGALSTQGAGGGAGGAAGDLNIAVKGTIEIGNGGQIDASTSTSGHGGAIGIAAGTLEIGSNGEIIASTSSSGMGGAVNIHANSLNIGGSGMVEATSEAGATGAAGSLTIDVSGGLNIQSGGEITASTASSGAAGIVTIKANSMDINGSATPAGLTGVFDESLQGYAGDTGGAARSINLTVTGALAIDGGGEISVATDTNGHGGGIKLKAGAIDIDSGGQIAASTSSLGGGGKVNIHANTLDINGSGTAKGDSTGILDISKQGHHGASGGAAGDLNIAIAGALALEDGGQISTATHTNGAGGDIRIGAGSVNAASGSEIVASTFSGGLGGQIILNAGSWISAARR